MKYRWLLPLFLIACCFAGLAPDSGQKEGSEFINRAIDKMDIFALPSFSMRAKVLIENQGKSLDGQYELLWNGPDQWRETTNFPGYDEIRVGGQGVVFLKRSTDFLPLQIFQMHAALGYGSAAGWGSFFHLGLQPKESISKIRNRKEHGSTIRCVEIKGPEKRGRELCVDGANGTVVRPKAFVDKQVLPIGNKLYPRTMSFLEQGKLIVQVEITQFQSPEQLPPSLFVPPDGALQQPGCMNPIPPRLVHRVNPSYPEQARQSYIAGTVSVDAVIGKDGVPHGLRVVSGVTRSLNDASLDALRQWGYEPATCDGTPVDYETIITVNYSLR